MHLFLNKKIRNLKTASAAGPDGIGPRMLQELENEIAPVLLVIYRRSLEFGEVPDDWRNANVTPIFKKGSKADPGNYRPVSLTSVCCKILESILRDEMMDHLLANNLLNTSQHGFTPGKSCCTNLLEFLEKQRKLLTKANLSMSSSWTLLRPLIKCQRKDYWRSSEHMV
jgi:hypothetical protein